MEFEGRMLVPPDEFSLEAYRDLNSDLAHMSDSELVDHYATYGQGEGRRCSTVYDRASFTGLVQSNDEVLEIGPFTQPIFKGGNVRYFDVLDRSGLIARAVDIGRPIDEAPVIDYVSATGDLGIVKRKFDVVASSHCIEHQPDLIGHLNHVERMLKSGGVYVLIIPDKRFCFDHFVPETTIASVIDAHERRLTSHRLESIIEHWAMTTHNVAARHWLGDHGQPAYKLHPEVIPRCVDAYRKANGEYIDVHAGQFTPQSFRALVSDLFAFGLIRLSPLKVYATLRNELEFFAVLVKEG